MPPIAEALVRILPDTRGFATNLEKQVRAEVKKVNDAKIPIKIKDVEVLKKFQTDLQRKVNQFVSEIKIAPLNVPVTVSSAQLEKEVKRAISDVKKRAAELPKIPVGTEIRAAAERVTRPAAQAPAQAVQQVVSATQTGAAKQAVSIKQGSDAIDKATGSTKKLTAADRELIAVTKSLDAAQLRLAGTENIGLGAKTESARLSKQLTSLGSQRNRIDETIARAQATRDRDAIARGKEIRRDIQQRIKDTTAAIPVAERAAQRAIAATKAQSAASKQAQRDEQAAATATASATELTIKSKQQLAGIDAKVAQETTVLAQAQVREAETTAALTGLENALSLARQGNRAATLGEIETLLPVVRLKQQDAAANLQQAETAAAAAAVEKKANADRAAGAAAANKLRATAVAQIANADRLAATAATAAAGQEVKRTQLSQAARTLLNAETVARNTNNASLATEIGLLRAETESKAESARASIATERQLAREARAHAQLARGAGASALTFAGLRGATLAASKQFLIGTAAVVGFAAALKQFATLEQSLNEFRVVAGATADEMVEVEEAAKRLGADITLPAVSATDAAQAMLALAKAGLSVNQAIAATRGVLQLATAAGIDNAQATELVASALNAFELRGSAAVRVADLFANAANAAQGSIVDFAVAQQQASAVAHQTGISLRDSIGFLTLFARAGLRGSDAGTSLRTALIRLINPTDEASAVLNDLGIQIRDVQGNIRPDVFAQFGEATAGLSDELRDMFAATIFGQDAIRAVLIAAREGRSGLAEVQAELNKQGTAADVAAAKTEGLTGKAEQLKNTLAGLGITIGEDVAPAIEEVADAAIEFFEGLNSGIGTVEDLLRPLEPLSGVLEKLFEVLAKGAVPALATLAALKAYRIGAEALTTVQLHLLAVERQMVVRRAKTAAAAGQAAAAARLEVAANRSLILSDLELVQAENAAALAAHRKAAAEGAAAAATRTAALSSALGALSGGLGIAVTAAIGFGLALSYLEGRESAVEKQTNKLAEAVQNFDTGNARSSILALRKELEALLVLTQVQALTLDFVSDEVVLQSFVLTLRDQAEAARESNPLLAHNLDLLADFIKLVDRFPTQKEMRFVFNNKETRTSIQEILTGISLLGGKGAKDAEDAVERIGGVFNQGLADIGHGVIGVPIEIEFLTPNLAQTLDRQLRDQLSQLEGIDLPLPPAPLPNRVKDLVNQMAAGGAQGRDRLVLIGKQLMEGLAEGIEEDDSAVEAARKNLADVIAAGEEALRQSVRTARSNVESFAGEVITSMNQAIDQMDFGIPTAQRQIVKIGLGVDLRDAQAALRQAQSEGLGREALEPFIEGVESAQQAINTFAKSGKTDIETLQRALEKLQEQQQRRQLVRGVESAQREFDLLKGTLAGAAAIAPGGSPVISQMLADQKALVTDAKDELKTFDLTNLIKGAERVRDAYKEAKEQGVKKLVDEFLRGKKTAEDFERQLRNQLGPTLEKLPDKNLGMQFTQAFRNQINTLVKQAQAVAGFLGIPGTIGPDIAEPAKVAAANAVKELNAAKELQKAIKGSSEKTAKNTGDTVKALLFISKALAGGSLTKAQVKRIESGDVTVLKELTNAKSP